MFRKFLLILLFISGCSNSVEDAKERLEENNIPINEESLRYAVELGYKEHISLLLKAGVDPLSNSGKLMKHTISTNQLDILGLLCKYSTKLDTVYWDWFNPLQFAVQEKNMEALRILINAGATPNIRNSMGEVPIMFAVRNHNYQLLEILLEGNAALSIKDKYQKTAVWYAINEGDEIALDLLTDAGAELQDEIVSQRLLSMASYRGNENIVEILLDAGANPNETSASGYSALMAGVSRGDESVVKLLLEAGANPNQITYDGFRKESVLDLAKRRGNQKIINLLQAVGAKPLLQEKVQSLNKLAPVEGSEVILPSTKE